MYKCLDCNTIFEELATISENKGSFWGAPAYEDVEACPECTSTNYTFADALPVMQTERLSGSSTWEPIEFGELTKYCLFRMRNMETNQIVTNEAGYSICIALSEPHIVDGEEMVNIDWVDINY